MNTDDLNSLVSSAIWRAEQLEEHGIGSARLAWAEVSLLEEELARALPVSQAEGRIARRGAVRAALKAEDPLRAQILADHFLAERGASELLQADLREILEEHNGLLTGRFRYAARRHGLKEARDLARRLQKSGPFGLAA